MKIILFNGPPGSGKDTAGSLLCSLLGNKACMAKFAQPLKTAVHAIMAIFRNTRDVAPSNAYEGDAKDVVSQDFLGVTPRQAYIQLSESFAKKLWGPSIFGEVLCNHLRMLKERGAEYVIVTDAGFKEEIQELISEFGSQNIMLVQVVRQGCSFAGDSRGWVDVEDFEDMPNSHLINNWGDLSELRREVCDLVNVIERMSPAPLAAVTGGDEDGA